MSTQRLLGKFQISPQMLEAGSLALGDLSELSSEAAATLAFQAMLDSARSSPQDRRRLRQALSE